jgi:hypothetical protein
MLKITFSRYAQNNLHQVAQNNHLMKIILSYLMKAILSVPDEGYFERT